MLEGKIYLCFPSFQHDLAGTQQGCSREGGEGPDSDPKMANAILVSQSQQNEGATIRNDGDSQYEADFTRDIGQTSNVPQVEAHGGTDNRLSATAFMILDNALRNSCKKSYN